MSSRKRTGPGMLVVLGSILAIFLVFSTVATGAAQTLAQALDAPWPFTTGGSANWYGQAAASQDGVDAAVSGAVGFPQQSWLETTRNFAEGTIHFYWRVTGGGTGSLLAFYVDGALQFNIGPGDAEWTHWARNVSAGEHTLRWVYAQGFGAEGRGWLDSVVFRPSNLLEYALEVQGWGAEVITGGYADWVSQTADTHDGVDAVMTPDLGMNRSSDFEITRTFSEGYVGFWWKVDYYNLSTGKLEFTIDSSFRASLNPRVESDSAWQYLMQPITAGVHTLRWHFDSGYVIDHTGAHGYVDQVTTGPLPTITIIATDPVATEAGPTSGQFTVTRTGDTTFPLYANYSVGGTAAYPADYYSLHTPAIIAAGASTATITLTPRDDAEPESDETVVVTLEAGTPRNPYAVGAPGVATVTIVSNDLPPTYYAITVNTPAHGTISCTTPVIEGGDAVCTMTPAATYQLSALTDNGADVLGSVVPGTPSSTYTIENVMADHAVAATFGYVPLIRHVCAVGCEYAKIQDAVDAAMPGDMINILPGVYRENVVVNGSRDLTIGQATMMSPTLSGNGAGPALTLTAGAGETVRVSILNLRLTGGAGTSGGGIRAVAAGGGLVEVKLANVLLYGNRATGSGGGVFLSASGAGSGAQLDLINSTVGGNRAARGGGVAVTAGEGGTIVVRGCNDVIHGNFAARGPDLSIARATTGRAIAHLAYSNVGKPIDASAGTWLPGNGMWSADPLFRNPARGDLHLHGDSPAIDRGVGNWQPPIGGLLQPPSFDLDGESRPQGAGIDQGADELVRTVATRVTLQSLTGWEVIPWGAAYNITWAAPVAATKFRVFYSSDNGTSWRAVSDAFLLKRHAAWKPPQPAKTARTWKVKVVGYTAAGTRVGAAVSPKPFTVTR